jgi:hypothetical protein
MWVYAQHWAQIAPGFTPIVALVAVLLAWRQLVLNRRNQRETTAKAIFREYLKFAVQYPELSDGKYETLQGIERERYEWLVGYLLWSAEELLDFVPTEKEDLWTKNLQMLANYHREYFENSPSFMTDEFDTYSAKTQDLIRRAIASGAGKGPSHARSIGQSVQHQHQPSGDRRAFPGDASVPTLTVFSVKPEPAQQVILPPLPLNSGFAPSDAPE